MKSIKITLIILAAVAITYLACTRIPEPAKQKQEAATPPPIESFDQISSLSGSVLEGFILKMGQAYENQDTAFLKTHIADDARIEVEQDGRTVSTNKEQYIALLEKAWSKIKDYQYSQSKPVIAIQDNLASVHLIVNESGSVFGRMIQSEIDASIEVKLIDGRIQIQQVTGQSKMSIQ